MTGPERQKIDWLERQVSELVRRLNSMAGPGVTTQAGVPNIRTVQPGFAAETTGPYDTSNDPSTGYPWKRKALDLTVPGLVNPAVQASGVNAFAISGDTSIAEGTDIWLEPSPDGSGYLLTLATGRPSYIVRLTANGTGIDGGIAWNGYTQKEVDGAVVDDFLIGGDGSGSSHFVLYATRADDGSVGNPEIDDRVGAFPDPEVAGRWLFIPKKITETNCADCGWLANMDDSVCLVMRSLGGENECDCYPTDPDCTNDPTQCIYMVKTPDLGGYVAVKMGRSCCGCGITIFNPPSTTDPRTATLYLMDYHVSCESSGSGSGSGSGGAELFSKTLSLSCCGYDGKNNQPYAIFLGWGTDTCDGVKASCDNVFRIRVECSTCPDPICDCPYCKSCCTNSIPYAFWADFKNDSAFPDNHWNGGWIWNYAGNCVYTADCEEGSSGSQVDYSSTLQPVEIDDVVYWQLDHAGCVYQKAESDWTCCGDNTMSLVSGDGPETISMNALAPNGNCPQCDTPLPDMLYATFGGYLSFLGTLPLYKNPADGSYHFVSACCCHTDPLWACAKPTDLMDTWYFGGDQLGGVNEDYLNISFACDSATGSAWPLDITGGAFATLPDTFTATPENIFASSCNPFLFTGTFAVTGTGVYSGGGTATVVISETAP